MAVPKRRTSKYRKNIRRSHHHIEPKAMIRCGNCSHAVIPHRVCPNCGYYRGRNVLHLDLFD
ncbi:MAG TPA: 50S ribosomal protein L32 [Planctomycetes bacterium]|nr:50S ribosomal protein L32 [Planctomycetota bacterium]